MANLRIVYDNAADRAQLSSTSQAGALGPSNLQVNRKYKSLRSVGTTQTINATWPTLESIDGIFMPFCALTPTSTVRVRGTREPIAVNLLTNSEKLETAQWNRVRVANVNRNVAVAPDGSLTADKILSDTSVGVTHNLAYSVLGLPDSTFYSASVFVKKSDYPRASLVFVPKSGSASGVLEINMDDGRVTRATPITGQTAINYKATDQGNGWYRLYIQSASTGVGSTVPQVRLYLSNHPNITSTFSKTGTTSTVDVTVAAPLINWAVDKLVESTGTSSHLTSATILTEINKTIVLEAYFKPLIEGAVRYPSFACLVGTGMAVQQSFTVDLLTNTVTLQATNTYTKNITVTDQGGGWSKVRCEVTSSLKGSFSWQIRLIPTPTASQSYTGDGVSGIYICQPYAYSLIPDNTYGPNNFDGLDTVVGDGLTQGGLFWGAQLETGTICTSYVPSIPAFVSRASTASYVASDGLIKTAAVNTPRIDYEPSTLQAAGLLLEPAATNMVTRSELTENAVWTKTALTVLANVTTAPDGTMTADKLVESTTNAQHSILQSITPVGSTYYTWSRFFKAAERNYAFMSVGGFSNQSLTTSIYLNLTTGVITGTGTDRATVTKFPNGWWRLSVVCLTISNPGNISPATYTSIDNITNSYLGDGTSGIYTWGAQMEVGQIPSSYIQTIATTVTRAADITISDNGTRPLGYIDNWQSYEYDSGTIPASLVPTIPIANMTLAQSIGAYAYGGGTSVSHWLPSTYAAYGVAITITDTVNPLGYIDISRLIIGKYWSPRYNTAFGMSSGTKDSSTSARSDSGDNIPTISTKSKELGFSLTWMDAGDRDAFNSLVRGCGSTIPMWVSLFPQSSSPGKEALYQIYGTLTDQSRITHSMHTMYSGDLNIIEV